MESNLFLSSDGTWKEAATKVEEVSTENAGIVPALPEDDADVKYLNGNAEWVEIPEFKQGNQVWDLESNSGLVPAPPELNTSFPSNAHLSLLSSAGWQDSQELSGNANTIWQALFPPLDPEGTTTIGNYGMFINGYELVKVLHNFMDYVNNQIYVGEDEPENDNTVLWIVP